MNLYFDAVLAKDLKPGQTLLQLENPKSGCPVLAEVLHVRKCAEWGNPDSVQYLTLVFRDDAPCKNFRCLPNSVIFALPYVEETL